MKIIQTLACSTILMLFISTGSLMAEDGLKNIDGYGKTTWGMNPEAVQSVERITLLDNQKKYKNGWIGMARIEELEIAGAKFSCDFIFGDNLEKPLRQVYIEGKEQANKFINVGTFSKIEKLLTEKYGPPIFKDDGEKISWRLGKTTIDITHWMHGGGLTRVTVVYRPAQAAKDEAKDL